MNSTTTIKVALADDHELIRKGISQMLENNDLRVVADADNGQELIAKLKSKPADIVLMDISMPIMDGIKTTAWLREHMPDVRVIALSVFDDDINVIRMLRAGARAYLLKNAKTKDLIRAIHDVHEKGYHFSDMVSNRLIQSIGLMGTGSQQELTISLSDRELEFLNHCCTELTYKEIGNLMHVSPRTAEGYGKALCEKLGLKSRVGLVLYAIKNRLCAV